MPPPDYSARRRRLEELKKIPEYTVVAPFFVRDRRGRPTDQIDHFTFPPYDVTFYSFDEAVEILRIFNLKWIDGNLIPPPALEAYAQESSEPQPENPARFTLRFVEPDLFKSASQILIVESPEEDEEPP